MMRFTYFLSVIFSCSLILNGAFAQNGPQQGKRNRITERQQLDSLQLLNEVFANRLDSLDVLLENEKNTSADLREQIIKLDDYRKKLEGNVDSVKDENLKLNQSNRILIVFNSLVAILLITSLVFFLRKIGKKKKEIVEVTTPVGGKQNEKARFTNFEDKLAQLERLGKLREKELLSEEEFVIEKQNILGK